MSVISEWPGLLEALKGEMTPKFLATRGLDPQDPSQAAPNVVPCVSIQPADDQEDTLFFGNFLLRKSIRNLEADSRLAVLVITPELQGWRLTGDLVEFQRTGPYVDRQMSGGLLRYNAYTGIRNAGVIRVRSVDGQFRISRLQVLLDFLRARLLPLPASPNGVTIPLPVQKEFARMAAVKVVSWIGTGGYPLIAPLLSLQPRGPRALAGWQGLKILPQPPDGARAAGNILTFEAISYQAKGIWQTRGRLGALRVQEIYAGGPPCPGGRVA